MKADEKITLHPIVENLLKIMKDKNLSKSSFSKITGIPIPKWSKITTGNQLLNVDDFSIIAKNLNMREIDIITYPDKYIFEKEGHKSKKSVFIGFEVDTDELATLGIADKVIKIIGK
jgi:predicted transcriptional regulator